MMPAPHLLPFDGDWNRYEETVYEAFLNTFVRVDIRFCGLRVKAQYRPETRGKGFSFWHTISSAPEKTNRDENDRIPDIRRCERISWISWMIENANEEGFCWWENERGNST